VNQDALHCLFLQDLEVFYANWNSDQVLSINDIASDDSGGNKQSFLTGTRPQTISAIDIYCEPGADDIFEVVIGTETGSIYHAALAFSDGNLEILEKFELMLELPDARTILDLKICQHKESFMVLAITDSTLY